MKNSHYTRAKVLPLSLILGILTFFLTPSVYAIGLFSIEMPVINMTSTIVFIEQNITNQPIAYNTTTNASLNQILNPTGNTDFSMGIYSLNFTFTGANAKSIDIEGIGAFTNDLLHIHQSIGNVGLVDLVHIETEDTDAIGLNISTAGQYSLIANKNISADWINAKINASYIQNSPFCTLNNFNYLNNTLTNGTFFQNIGNTCSVATRGAIRLVAGAENITDYSYICMKNSTNNYNWVQLAIG